MTPLIRSVDVKKKRGRPRRPKTIAVKIQTDVYDFYSRVALRLDRDICDVLTQELKLRASQRRADLS